MSESQQRKLRMVLHLFCRRIPGRAFCVLAACLACLGAEPAAPCTDRYGDPLPAGALARMGSVRLLHDAWTGPMKFSPDGKTLAVLTGHPQKNALHFWDVATGKHLRRAELDPYLIYDFAYTPDGRSVVVLGVDAVSVVDVGRGKIVRRLNVSRLRAQRMALAPDGKTIALGCIGFLDQANPIVLLDLVSGKERGRLEGHRTPVEALRFSADGKRLRSASDDYQGTPGTRFGELIHGSLCVWEMPAGKRRRKVEQKGRRVAFSADGKTLAYTGKDKRVHLWDLDADKELGQIPGDGLTYLFLPGGKTLAAGSYARPMCVWDVATGKLVRRFRDPVGRGTEVRAVSPNGKTLASVSAAPSFDRAVRLWDAATGKERRPFGGHQALVSCVAFTPDGRRVVSGSADGTLRVWDAGTGKELRVYAEHEHPVAALAIAPDGKLVASEDEAGGVHLWDLASGKRLRRWQMPGPVRDERTAGFPMFGFSPDGKTVVAGSGTESWTGGGQLRLKGSVSFWDVATGKRVRSVEETDSLPAGVTSDGRGLVLVHLVEPNVLQIRESLLLRSLVSGKTLWQIEGELGEVYTAVVVSPDGKALASRSLTGQGGPFGGTRSAFHQQLREAATGKEVLKLERGGNVMAFSPDGKTLAVTGGEEPGVFLVDAVTGKEMGQVSGHLGEVRCLAFSPDGKRLATGSTDQTVLVWNLAALKQRRPPVRVDSSRENLGKLWADLGGADAGAAYRAVWELAAVPGDSIPLLKERLRPVPGVPAERIERYVKDLDSDRFTERERATAALEKVGVQAETALRRVLAGKPSLEVRRRAERLLAKVEGERVSAAGLRASRATAVLERIGTRAAREVLRGWAGGAPGAILTEEANGALRRLARRGAAD